MRTQKFDNSWQEYFLGLDDNTDVNSPLEGVVLLSIFGHVNQEKVPSFTAIDRSIDEIVSRVTELVDSCSQKSTKKTISFINQVLYKEMGFQGIAKKDQTLDNLFFDKVQIYHTFLFQAQPFLKF